MLFGFIPTAQRAYGSYLLQEVPYRPILVSKGFAEGNGSGLFESAMNKVKKLIRNLW